MAAGDTITFSGTHDLLRIADAGGFASIITSFAASGQIDVQGIGTAKSAQASGDALKLFPARAPPAPSCSRSPTSPAPAARRSMRRRCTWLQTERPAAP